MLFEQQDVSVEKHQEEMVVNYFFELLSIFHSLDMYPVQWKMLRDFSVNFPQIVSAYLENNYKDDLLRFFHGHSDIFAVSSEGLVCLNTTYKLCEKFPLLKQAIFSSQRYYDDKLFSFYHGCSEIFDVLDKTDSCKGNVLNFFLADTILVFLFTQKGITKKLAIKEKFFDKLPFYITEHLPIKYFDISYFYSKHERLLSGSVKKSLIHNYNYYECKAIHCLKVILTLHFAFSASNSVPVEVIIVHLAHIPEEVWACFGNSLRKNGLIQFVQKHILNLELVCDGHSIYFRTCDLKPKHFLVMHCLNKLSKCKPQETRSLAGLVEEASHCFKTYSKDSIGKKGIKFIESHPSLILLDKERDTVKLRSGYNWQVCLEQARKFYEHLLIDLGATSESPVCADLLTVTRVKHYLNRENNVLVQFLDIYFPRKKILQFLHYRCDIFEVHLESLVYLKNVNMKCYSNCSSEEAAQEYMCILLKYVGAISFTLLENCLNTAPCLVRQFFSGNLLEKIGVLQNLNPGVFMLKNKNIQLCESVITGKCEIKANDFDQSDDETEGVSVNSAEGGGLESSFPLKFNGEITKLTENRIVKHITSLLQHEQTESLSIESILASIKEHNFCCNSFELFNILVTNSTFKVEDGQVWKICKNDLGFEENRLENSMSQTCNGKTADLCWSTSAESLVPNNFNEEAAQSFLKTTLIFNMAIFPSTAISFKTLKDSINSLPKEVKSVFGTPLTNDTFVQTIERFENIVFDPVFGVYVLSPNSVTLECAAVSFFIRVFEKKGIACTLPLQELLAELSSAPEQLQIYLKQKECGKIFKRHPEALKVNKLETSFRLNCKYEWKLFMNKASDFYTKILKDVGASVEFPLPVSYLSLCRRTAEFFLLRFLAFFPGSDIVDMFYYHSRNFVVQSRKLVSLRKETKKSWQGSPEEISLRYFVMLLKHSTGNSDVMGREIKLSVLKECLETAPAVVKEFFQNNFQGGLKAFFSQHSDTFNIVKKSVELRDPRNTKSAKTSKIIHSVEPDIESNDELLLDENFLETVNILHTVEKNVVALTKSILGQISSVKIEELVAKVNRYVCSLSNFEVINIILDNSDLFTLKEGIVTLIDSDVEDDLYPLGLEDTNIVDINMQKENSACSELRGLGYIQSVNKLTAIIFSEEADENVYFTNLAYISENGTSVADLRDQLKVGDCVEFYALLNEAMEGSLEPALWIGSVVHKSDGRQGEKLTSTYQCIVTHVSLYYALLTCTSDENTGVKIIFPELNSVKITVGQLVTADVCNSYPLPQLWKAISVAA